MAAGKRYWEDVKEGDPLPEVRVAKLTRTDFVKYAGASGDFNPIHHDQTFAEASGNPTVFAMGMLNASILSRVITAFAGRPNVREGVTLLGAALLFGAAGLIDAALGFVSDPTEKAELQRFRDRTAAIADYSRPLTIGVNPADSFTAALFAHRDPATLAWSNEPLLPLPPPVVVPVDVPPWWRMNKKHAMFYVGAGRGER